MEKVINFFNREKTYIPEGFCYAVLRGDYYGEIFCFFRQNGEKLYFVTLPKMELREVEKTKFDIGLKEKILDPIEKLPRKIFKTVQAHGNSLLIDK